MHALSNNPGLADAALEATSHPSSVLQNDIQWSMVRGLAFWHAEKFEEGFRVLRDANSGTISNPDFFGLLGMLARRVPGQEDTAEAAYWHCLQLCPGRPDIHYNLGNLLKENDPNRAIACYVESLRLDPYASSVWHNYGATLNESCLHIPSLYALKNSLYLDPFDADAWCNLGLTYFQLEKFEASKMSFVHAIGLDKTNASSYVNYGQVLIETLEPEKALFYMRRGVELDKSSFNSLWNLSLALLLLGHYKEGWRYYEARFYTEDLGNVNCPTSISQDRVLSRLPSEGSPELVVWSEQGIGDSLQFVRYLPLLEERGVPYLFMAHKPLVRLYKNWLGLGDRVSEKLPQAKCFPDVRPHIPLLSLPHLFGTVLETIPSNFPYLQAPAPTPSHLVVKQPPGGLSVGVVWATNPDNKKMYRNKSMPASLLIPPLINLLKLDLIEIHSLQVGEDSCQLNPWIATNGVHNWGSIVEDFSDTAYIINQLDFVITVDTAVAHLAGALQKPTWLLLPHNADFRWLYRRNDSPWYPSMRLFRQKNRGDWSGVMADVQEALNQMFLLDLPNLSEAQLV